MSPGLREVDRAPRPPHISLHSTGAIGDAVISTAVRYALEQKGFTVSLISSPSTLSLWGKQHEVEPEDTQSYGRNIEIGDYLSQLPHARRLPSGEFGHLSQWMGKRAEEQLGIDLHVSRDNVKIELSALEVKEAKDLLRKLSPDEKPIVILSPNAGTKNRSLETTTVLSTVNALREFAVPAFLDPIPDIYKQIDIPHIGSTNLREVAAILYAADAFVGVDSGPFHIAAASIQGTPQSVGAQFEVSQDPKKIIVITGSSRGEVIAYNGNQIIEATGGCPIAPCGAHGYSPLETYENFYSREFYPARRDKDNSGCIYPNYPQVDTSHCMGYVNPDEIINRVKIAIGK